MYIYSPNQTLPIDRIMSSNRINIIHNYLNIITIPVSNCVGLNCKLTKTGVNDVSHYSAGPLSVLS